MGTALNVRGRLIAEGSSSNNITFTSSSLTPAKSSWAGVNLLVDTTGSGTASFTYSNFSFADIAINVQSQNLYFSATYMQIANCTFDTNRVGVFGYLNTPESTGFVIQQSTFNNNDHGVEGKRFHVNRSTFTNNAYGVFQGDEIYVFNSLLTSNQVAVNDQRALVRSNTISNNDIGIEMYLSPLSVEYNEITQNRIGVKLSNQGGGIYRSNIYANTEHNVVVISSATPVEGNTWWGTTDTSAIDAKIYDGLDDPQLAVFQYQPVVTQPWVSTDAATVTPTITSTPTALPTGTDTNTPTSTNTATAGPSSTPTNTPTITSTAMATNTPTRTSTATVGSSSTSTVTNTPTTTSTPANTSSPTRTSTTTATVTPSATPAQGLPPGFHPEWACRNRGDGTIRDTGVSGDQPPPTCSHGYDRIQILVNP